MRRARGWLKQRGITMLRRARVRTRAWLQGHPRIRALLHRTGCLDVDERTLARGVGVGLFIGLTPTVGIQSVLMLGASMVLRANFPAAFIASCINNPLTFAPLYFGFHQLGEYLLLFIPIRFESLSGLEADIAEETAALLFGSLAIATPVAILGYAAFVFLWRKFDLHLPQRADRLPPLAADRENPE